MSSGLPASSLPVSIQDSSVSAAKSALAVLRGAPGGTAHVEWATNTFDETFTSLKLCEDFLKNLVNSLADDGQEEDSSAVAVALHYPDSGTAAYVRHSWEWDTVRGASPDTVFSLDQPFPSSLGEVEKAGPFVHVMVCPKASESEAFEAAVEAASCDPDSLGCLVLNPNLIDMGVTGLGYSSRLYQERVMDRFIPAYFLRTYQDGAVVYEGAGKAWTLWKEDDDEEGGFRMLEILEGRTPDAEVQMLLMEGEAEEEGFIGSLAGFINGMMRL